MVSDSGTLTIRGRLMTINAITLVPGRDRLPADQRHRLGDDLHRPGDPGSRSVARRPPAPRRPPPGKDFDLRVLDHAARCGRHLGAAMSVPRNMLKELVDRKLWPIALVLIIALVAVPVLLTKQAPTDIVNPPTGPLPYSLGHHAAGDLGADDARATRTWAARAAIRSPRSTSPRRRRRHRTSATRRRATGATAGTGSATGGSSSKLRHWRRQRHGRIDDAPP